MKTWKEVRKEFNFTQKEEEEIAKYTKKILNKIDKKATKVAKKEQKKEAISSSPIV